MDILAYIAIKAVKQGMATQYCVTALVSEATPYQGKEMQDISVKGEEYRKKQTKKE
jgi:hypothetical protein